MNFRTQPNGFWIPPSTNREAWFLQWTELLKIYVIEGGLRVMNVQSGAFQKHVITYLNCGWLSRIVGILFKSSSKNANFLALEVLIKLSVNSQEKVFLSEFVHKDNLVPVISYFGEILVLSQINQGQNIFFKAASSEAHWAVEEFVSDSGVRGNTFFDFLDIRSVLLAHNCNTVDWRDSLSEETVCGKFGQFGRRVSGMNDAFLSNVFE
jgi:hypothetical protein